MRTSPASQSAISLVHTSRPSERHTHGRFGARTGSLVCATIQSSICRPAVGARPHITVLELVCIDRCHPSSSVMHDPVRPLRQNEAGEPGRRRLLPCRRPARSGSRAMSDCPHNRQRPSGIQIGHGHASLAVLRRFVGCPDVLRLHDERAACQKAAAMPKSATASALTIEINATAARTCRLRHRSLVLELETSSFQSPPPRSFPLNRRRH